MFKKHIFILFLSLSCILPLSFSHIYADYTYLTYDKLIFGNGGGLELVSTDNESYYLQVLNLSGSEETYQSKGFSIDGKLMSVIPVTANTYIQSDHMLMATEATFTSGVIPSLNTTSEFPEDQIFFVGEYEGKFMLLNENTITGYELDPNVGYKKSPIYFQQDNGPLFMGRNSLNEPVLSIYPSINSTAYIGINRADPIETITVSGDLKVENGTVVMENPFGIAAVQYSELNAIQFNNVTSDVLVSQRDFELSGYVSANVMVFGQLSSRNTIYATWMFSFLKIYYLSGGVWLDYPNPLYPGKDMHTLSRRDTDGDTALSAYALYPYMCVQLNPNISTGSQWYRVELWGRTGGSLYYDTDQGHIYVFGLPSGSYEDVSVSSPTTELDSNELFDSALLSLDGNYLTDQLLSFGSGGGIAESGTNIIFTNGNDYMDFKASNLSFGEYHNIDSLKILNNTTAYPFQLGVDAANLGIDSEVVLYNDSLVSQNIQTLTTAKGPSSINLNIQSDVYIGDSISILTNGEVSPNVDVGDVDTDTNIALNVAGNLLFTGSYDGDLIKVFHKAVTLNITDKYSDSYFNNGHPADKADDVLQFHLDPSLEWTLLFFTNASAKLQDDNDQNYLSMWVERANPTGVTGGYITPLYVDNDKIKAGNFYNMYYIVYGGGDYSVYLNLRVKRFEPDVKAGKLVDFSNDGVYSGSTMDVEEYGGYIGVIAIPKGPI